MVTDERYLTCPICGLVGDVKELGRECPQCGEPLETWKAHEEEQRRLDAAGDKG